MDITGKAEHLVEDVIGCGIFQAILFILTVGLTKIPMAYSLMLMSFGRYNPGWRCLDNVTTIHDVNTSVVRATIKMLNQSADYEEGSCEAYSACREVEFNPESTTVVTEWALLCDREWIPSLIISTQMIGMVSGSYIGGHLADYVGRKRTLYAGFAFGAGLHLTSSFSNSVWMFWVVRFFVGALSNHILLVAYMYNMEMMTARWRGTLVNVPDWQIGALVLAISAMVFRNWRHVELFGCFLYAIGFLGVFWTPESLRWLEVKNKTKEITKIAQRMAWYNRKQLSDIDNADSEILQSKRVDVKDDKKYTLLDVFRKGYRYKSFVVAFTLFMFSVMYYGITFGVKSLHGDFYINLILMVSIEIPFNFVGMFALRYIRRKRNIFGFIGLFVVGAFIVSGLSTSDSYSVKTIVTPLILFLAKSSLGTGWNCMYVINTELYPTVIRGIGFGWGQGMARLGGILVPFALPKEKGSLFVYLIVMGVIGVVCCVLTARLPETKDKPLKERFEKFESADRQEETVPL